MRKLVLLVVLSAAVALCNVEFVSAHGHCGGYGYGGCGWGGCGYGCGYSYCGYGCGYGYSCYSSCYYPSYCYSYPSCGYGYGGGYSYGGGGGYYSAAPAYGTPGTAVAVTPPGSAAATLVVNLPADARLTIDDHQMVSTSSRRTFQTPALDTTKDYHYTLKAEVTRNGKTESKVEDVTVRGGKTTTITLDVPATTVAAR